MMSMLLVVFLMFGAISFFSISLDLTPKIDVPYISIQTVYAGAGPAEIETQITKKIEDEVSSISKIDEIISYSMEGVSFINMKFEMDKDADVANQEVKDKVDAILNDLPDDADLPKVQKLNVSEFPIVEVILSGDLSATELWDLADKRIKNRFSQIEGVARTDITGGKEREIQVRLNDRTVFQNKIDLNQLSQILAAQNMDMPGGHFEENTQEYTVRLTGELESVNQLSELEVPTASGNKRLKDIAEVVDAGAEVRQRTTFFDNATKSRNPDAVLLSIVKNSEGNTVEIAQAIDDALPTIEESLPAGCKLEMVTDKSKFIKSTVNDTLSNILLGIVFTGLVLLFFLHDLRSTIIVALAMPLSIVSTFLLMDISGFTKNIMTLMGLSTAVGVLVSNSVVVLENIFRHKSMGKPSREAASVGTSQVVVAVIASTATNIAVFLPVANMTGIMGQFFKEFALTVTFATLFSLLISFTLTPMMAALILPDKETSKKRKLSDMIERWMGALERAYKNSLVWLLSLKRRSVYMLIAAILLLFGTLSFGGKVGFEFIPMFDEGDIRIEVELPLGYSLDQTADVLETIEQRLAKEPTVKHVLTQIGKISDINEGTYLALMKVKLIDASKRKLTTDETANKFIQQFSDIPNVMLRIRATSSMDMSGQAPMTFYLKGQDQDELEKYKEQYIAAINDVPGLVNLNTSSRSGKPEISIIPDRKKLSDAGLTVYSIAMQLRGALTGLVATQYRESGEEYDVRVMVEDASVDSPESIANFSIVSQGHRYALSQLADIEFSQGVSRIFRLDRFKAIEFTGAPAPGYALGDLTSEISVRLDQIELPEGYRYDWGGFAKMMNEAIIDMGTTLLIAIALTYMLLAAILESLKQPLYVLGTFPLALIGVIGGMVMTGATMNIVSMMAVVMLLGVVVNNAILILDYMNELVRDKGMDVQSALLEACPAKLRPILMSSIAIILGMLPMAMGMGESGVEMRQPMGIVSIGGLVVSTILTLFVIPALYNLISGGRSKGGATHAA